MRFRKKLAFIVAKNLFSRWSSNGFQEIILFFDVEVLSSKITFFLNCNMIGSAIAHFDCTVNFSQDKLVYFAIYVVKNKGLNAKSS